MTARRSLLSPSRAEIAAEIGRLLGRDRGANIRYGARFDPRPHRAEVPDSAWHPTTQLTSRRGTTNGNDRGSAEDRRRRKRYLLDTYGDGHTVRCAFGCGAILTFETVTVDRFPVRGKDGGKYTRDNIRPACGSCNYEDGGRNTPRKGKSA